MEEIAEAKLIHFCLKRSSLDFYLSTQSQFILVVWPVKREFLKEEAYANKEIPNAE